MQTSEQGIALIKRFEGFSAAPYFCPAGKPTIGYGHVIRQGEAFPYLGISEQQATSLLKQDLIPVENTLKKRVVYPINQCQFDALASFIYNAGIQAFEKSTLLRILNQGDVPSAAAQFNRWVYAAGKPLEGLKKRREAEKSLFLRVVIQDS